MNEVKPGRPRKAATDQWSVYIPRGLAGKIDLLFLNPVTGKVSYGYRSSLVTQLLREWLQRQVDKAQAEAAPDELDTSGGT